VCLGLAIEITLIYDNVVESKTEILELSWRIMGSAETSVHFVIRADKLWKKTF